MICFVYFQSCLSPFCHLHEHIVGIQTKYLIQHSHWQHIQNQNNHIFNMDKCEVTSSNWKDVWKVKQGRVQSLWYYALRCALMNLVECLFKLQKVFSEKYGIEGTLDRLYFGNSKKILEDNYERIQDLLSGKEIQALIDHHEPYREILSRTDLSNVYHRFMRNKVISYKGKNENCNTNYCEEHFESEDSLLTFFFWLCFENTHTESLYLHQVIEPYPDEDELETEKNCKNLIDLVIEYITNNKHDMKQCTTLEICIEKMIPGHHSFPTLKVLDRFFRKFPNLETLDIDARKTKANDWTSDRMTFLYDKKGLFFIISKIELSTLKIHISEEETEDFCHYLAIAPNTLENLAFRYELKGLCRSNTKCTRKALTDLIMIMKALKKQTNLKTIYMNIVLENVTSELLNSVEEEIDNPIDNVTTINIESYSTMIMKLIDKYFINVKKLTMQMRSFDYRQYNSHNIERTSIPVLKNFKSVESFKMVFVREDGQMVCEEPEEPSSNLFTNALTNFPSLTCLHLNHCSAIHPENVPVLDSLKALVLNGGNISPPNLVSKMPKLEKIFSLNEVCETEEDHEIMKRLLPHNCEIIEEMSADDEDYSMVHVEDYYFATKLLCERWAQRW